MLRIENIRRICYNGIQLRRRAEDTGLIFPQCSYMDSRKISFVLSKFSGPCISRAKAIIYILLTPGTEVISHGTGIFTEWRGELYVP